MGPNVDGENALLYGPRTGIDSFGLPMINSLEVLERHFQSRSFHKLECLNREGNPEVRFSGSAAQNCNSCLEGALRSHGSST
jgi:hypothetical protein